MTIQPDISDCNVLLVAPYCFDPNSDWFSPGRIQKISQVESLLFSLSLRVLRINTSPTACPPSDTPTLQLTQNLFPLYRLLNSAFSISRFLLAREATYSSPFLWVYNSRLSEALVALLILFFIPKCFVCLQVEDLPNARVQNAGVRGLLDLLCLNLLARRANSIFVVSHVVGKSLLKMVRFCGTSPAVQILPPLLNPEFLALADKRTPPFARETTTILYAGGYGSDKGVEDLITAFSCLPADHSTLQLVGAIPEAFANLCSTIPGIKLIGHVASFDLYRLYAQADVVVSPHHVSSRSTSIFPFKLIEYVASGALPLTTRMPGIEQLSLPSACIFDSVEQLTSILHMAKEVWMRNSSELSECSVNIRNQYSISAYAPKLTHALKLD